MLQLAVLVAGAIAFTRYVTAGSQTSFDGPVAVVERGSVVERTVVVGRIVPRDEVQVRPTINGLLTEVLVTPGQSVEEGELVATVRPVADPVSLANARNRVDRAVIRLEAAQRDVARRNAANRGGAQAVSREQVNRLEDDVALARTDLAAARREVTLLARGSSSAEGQASTRVVSPISGTVLDVPVTVGTFVSATNSFRDGTAVALVAEMDDLLFKGRVDEAHVDALRIGMRLELQVGARSGERLTAVLEHIATQASIRGAEDSESAAAGGGVTTFEIWASLDSGELDQLRSGYSATAEIIVDQREDVLLVDEGSLVFNGGSAFVYVVNEQKELDRRPVQLGLSDGMRIEVLEGLDLGERVALQLDRAERD
ncbi:MAG: efflux RND transporter periplasmic adaptor subunit [Myxococcota bacterium]